METVVPILFPITFVVLLVVERIFPARPLPKVRFWLLKAFAFFVIGAVVGGLVPLAFAQIVRRHTPIDLGFLGGAAGGVLGFLATDIVAYGVHRLLHNVPFLWRWTHQMHHSAERVDIAGANYFHPFDVAIQAGATTLAVAVLGFSPDAIALAAYLSFFAAMFQHLNVRTPRWVGWILQRPEAHSIHHARGVHAYNYGNFVLWDVLFGTYRNPDGFTGPAGFWDGASSRMGKMLLGRDVGDPSARNA